MTIDRRVLPYDRTAWSSAAPTEAGKKVLRRRVAPEVVPLPVLDLVPIGSGSTAADALVASTALARRTEERGHRRYRVADHHGMAGVGSSSPAVLIAHLAGATSTVLVGIGVDEPMVTSATRDPAHRLRSCELLSAAVAPATV